MRVDDSKVSKFANCDRTDGKRRATRGWADAPGTGHQSEKVQGFSQRRLLCYTPRSWDQVKNDDSRVESEVRGLTVDLLDAGWTTAGWSKSAEGSTTSKPPPANFPWATAISTWGPATPPPSTFSTVKMCALSHCHEATLHMLTSARNYNEYTVSFLWNEDDCWALEIHAKSNGRPRSFLQSLRMSELLWCATFSCFTDSLNKFLGNFGFKHCSLGKLG